MRNSELCSLANKRASPGLRIAVTIEVLRPCSDPRPAKAQPMSSAVDARRIIVIIAIQLPGRNSHNRGTAITSTTSSMTSNIPLASLLIDEVSRSAR